MLVIRLDFQQELGIFQWNLGIDASFEISVVFGKKDAMFFSACFGVSTHTAMGNATVWMKNPSGEMGY